MKSRLLHAVVVLQMIFSGPMPSIAFASSATVTPTADCVPDADGYNCADEATKRQMRDQAERRGQQDGDYDGAPDGQQDGYRDGQYRGQQDGERDGRKRSYDQGHDRGEIDGRRDGDSDGDRNGRRQGDADGDRRGTADGLQAGYDDGYNRGNREGYNKGYTDGTNSGAREDGYRTGYADGKAQAIRDGQANGHRDGYAKGVKEREASTDRQASQNVSVGVPSQIEGPQLTEESAQVMKMAMAGERRLTRSNPYTAPELRAAYDRGYNEGYKRGRDRAYKQAYREAYNRAYDNYYNRDYRDEYDRGYDDGHEDGYRSAYDSAYNRAYRSAYDNAYRSAYDRNYPVRQEEGYKDGYQIGYSRGYSQGKTDAYNAGYKDGRSQGYTDFYQKTYDDYFKRGYAECLQHYKTHAVLRFEDVVFTEANGDGVLQRGETFALQFVIHNFGEVASGKDVIMKLSDSLGAMDLPMPTMSLPALAARTSTTLMLRDVGRASVKSALAAKYRLNASVSNTDQGQLFNDNLDGQVLYPVQVTEQKFSRVTAGKAATVTITVKNISNRTTPGNVRVKTASLNKLGTLTTDMMSISPLPSGQTGQVTFTFQVDQSTPQFEKLPFTHVLSDDEKKNGESASQVYAIRPYAYNPQSGFLLITDQIDKTSYRPLVESWDRAGIAYDLWDLGNEGMINKATLANYKDKAVYLSLAKGLSLGGVSAPLAEYLGLNGNLVMTGEGVSRGSVGSSLDSWLDLRDGTTVNASQVSGIDFLTGTKLTLNRPVTLLSMGMISRPLLGPAVEQSVDMGATPSGVMSSGAKVFSLPFEKSKRQYKAAILPFDLAALSDGERDALMIRLRGWSQSFDSKLMAFAAAVQAGNTEQVRAVSEGILAEFEEELVSDRRYKTDFGASIYFKNDLKAKSRFTVYTKWAVAQKGAVKTAAFGLWPEMSKIIESLGDKSGSSRYMVIKNITKPLH